MKKITLIIVFFTFICLGLPLNSYAGFVTDDPSLPPIGGEYEKPDLITLIALGVDITDISHSNFFVTSRTDNGTDEFEEFTSTLEFIVDDGLGNLDPIVLNGTVNVTVFGKVGNVTGTFDTEIVSMNLTGNNFITGLGFVDIILTESGIFDSVGQTTISDFPAGVLSKGGGPSPCLVGPCFKIDSFFDVFFDIEIVGVGQDSGNGRILLIHNVPEPTTLALFSAGLGLFGWKNRKGKTRLTSC